MDSGPTLPSELPPTSRGLVEGQAIFGRYLLKKIIGRGGMGIVWSAHDNVLDEDVALKFLPDLVRWDQAALEELKAETRRARTLTHPHIVRIHDLVEDASGAAISMELVEGHTLTELRLAKPGGVLAPADILPWIGQLCAALDYAHAEARIVHHDLKPANILLTTDGRIKVTDFGVARSLVDAMSRVSTWGPSGTLLYMSPQQTMGEPSSPADDLYSLGALLYELLTGKPPFYTGDVRSQVCLRVPDSVAQRRKTLGVHAERIPAAWESALAACLAKSSEKRPATAGEIASRLLAPEKTKSKSPRNRWRTRPAFLAALVLVVGATGWVRWKSAPIAAAPSATVGTTFASDATRALAAWNLDGDGRDATGRGLHFRLSSATPVEDRFGRIDRALFFNGHTTVEHVGLPAAGWGADRPFTVAFWLKPASRASTGCTLVTLQSDRQDDFYWSVNLAGSRLGFHLGRTEVGNPDSLTTAEVLAPDRWTHVAAVSDGRAMWLCVDGQEVARQPVTRNRGARFSAPPSLLVGFGNRFDTRRFVGAMDELRIWPRALPAKETAQLATAEAPPRFAPTHGSYPEREDLPAAVQREFGPAAALADWQDIRRWHADDTLAFCESLDLTIKSGTLLVQNGGQRFVDQSRHYFINRFDGRKPDYFKAHEELGGMTLALGSWFGSNLRALARLPFAAPVRTTVHPGPDGEVHSAALADREAQRVSLQWSQELRRDAPGTAARVRLQLRDGRTLQAVCAPIGVGMFALALGDATRPEFTRQIGANYDTLAFTLVLKPGWLTFRAVGRLGAEPLFQESVPLPGLTAAEILSWQLPGVDAAELVVEK